MTRTRHPENPLTAYTTLDGSYARYLEELESVFASVATLLRPGGHLVINAAATVSENDITPLADDIAGRVARQIERRDDLVIAWDAIPPGIIEDRCLVFVKTNQPRERSLPASASAETTG